MADGDKAWAFVLGNEDTVPPSGKVTAEPNGAQSRLGINSRWHPEALSDGFYSMPLADALLYAENIFHCDYWDMILGSQIVSQLIGSKWADLAFNGSVHESTLLVQRAANSIWPAQPIKADGVCGAWTIARIDMIIGDHEAELYDAIIVQGEHFYEVLRAKHPDKFSQKLEEDWLARLHLRPPEK